MPGLEFSNFISARDAAKKNAPSDHLSVLRWNPQTAYIRSYLTDLSAQTIIKESEYFDRDYLESFAAFYSTTSRHYSNTCDRLHFFSSKVDRRDVVAAASGDERAVEFLQEHYLGFAVLRPFSPPCLGRTVIKWYDDTPMSSVGPREMATSRDYYVHLVGVRLRVRGLAWQQQDRAVSSCAIVALWSMFHSSAFDDHHAIPTTADIAMRVHGISWQGRVYPSPGLSEAELSQAIRAFDLSPIVLDGDRIVKGKRCFSRETFATTCATLIRSGYPVLIACSVFHPNGSFAGVRHAICATGFRVASPLDNVPEPGRVYMMDSKMAFIYVHDDNWGPNARYAVEEWDEGICLKLAPPDPRTNEGDTEDDARKWEREHCTLVPSSLFVAVHSRMRLTPNALLQTGRSRVAKVLADLTQQYGATRGVVLSARFIGVRDYLHDELPRLFRIKPSRALSAIRMALIEDVGPTSLHLGIVRLGLASGMSPSLDILYDATDSPRFVRPIATIIFDTDVPESLHESLLKNDDVSAVLGRVIYAIP